jgi:tetratricopeptide (TPR) repeat protein
MKGGLASLVRRVAIAGTISLGSPVALAQDLDRPAPSSLQETLTGDAKADYESGRRLYERGEYAGALAKFESAARTSNDARLWWNASVCEAAMKHYAAAIALMRRYLDSKPQALQREGQDFIRAAEAHTARIDVQACALLCESHGCGCRPGGPGGVVSVDGDPIGAIPLASDARVDLGVHRLSVKSDGFEEYSTALHVTSSAAIQVIAVLVPAALPARAPVVPLADEAPGGRTAPPPLGQTLLGAAKADYESGRRLYERGDYAGALAKFQSASRTSNDPRLWWDAAACEAAMKHYARATTLVRRYLDSHPRSFQREAWDFLQDAEASTARIRVEGCALLCESHGCECRPGEPGGLVSVDGEPIGAIPLPPDTRVDLGTHELTVKKDGFGEYSTALNVTGSAEIHVRAVLVPVAPPEGRLVVRAGSGDTIAIDGVTAAIGTWTGVLPGGPHSVRVTRPQASPFETEVVVEAYETRTLDCQATAACAAK